MSDENETQGGAAGAEGTRPDSSENADVKTEKQNAEVGEGTGIAVEEVQEGKADPAKDNGEGNDGVDVAKDEQQGVDEGGQGGGGEKDEKEDDKHSVDKEDAGKEDVHKDDDTGKEKDTVKPEVDAGKPEVDAGKPEVDAGKPEVDAGKAAEDAGKGEVDAVKPEKDTGQAEEDAEKEQDAGKVAEQQETDKRESEDKNEDDSVNRDPKADNLESKDGNKESANSKDDESRDKETKKEYLVEITEKNENGSMKDENDVKKSEDVSVVENSDEVTGNHDLEETSIDHSKEAVGETQGEQSGESPMETAEDAGTGSTEDGPDGKDIKESCGETPGSDDEVAEEKDRKKDGEDMGGDAKETSGGGEGESGTKSDKEESVEGCNGDSRNTVEKSGGIESLEKDGGERGSSSLPCDGKTSNVDEHGEGKEDKKEVEKKEEASKDESLQPHSDVPKESECMEITGKVSEQDGDQELRGSSVSQETSEKQTVGAELDKPDRTVEDNGCISVKEAEGENRDHGKNVTEADTEVTPEDVCDGKEEGESSKMAANENISSMPEDVGQPSHDVSDEKDLQRSSPSPKDMGNNAQEQTERRAGSGSSAYRVQTDYLTRQVLAKQEHEIYLEEKLSDSTRDLEIAERKVKDLQLRLKRFAKDDEVKDSKIMQMERDYKDLAEQMQTIEESLDSKSRQNNNVADVRNGALSDGQRRKRDSKVCVIL